MTTESSSLLIVDDDELSREGLARHLRRQGYAVTLAKNGEQAIERLTDRHFDLVLLDVMMPRMTGLEVLKFLRRCDSLIDLPIIMVTAKREGEDIIEALELGANDYVTKPLDLPVVLARIRTQLALRRAVSQALELKQKLDARNRELEQAAAELAAVQERGQRDREVAARVQQAFLPGLPEVPGARLAWIFQPCDPFTGDFLAVFPPGDRHLGLCLLDVNGHGPASALLAVTISQLLARLASPPPSSGRCAPGDGVAPVPPAQVVGQMARQLSGGAEAVPPLSLLYGTLSLDTREFRFVCAGHPGPVHLPLGSPPVLLEVTEFPVGIGTAGYREQVVKLQPGDRLVLYSDGATQARNAHGEHFGSRRLLNVLEQTCRAPLDESLQALWKEVEGWRGEVPRRDDLSLLAVEMAGPEAPEGGTAAGPP